MRPQIAVACGVLRKANGDVLIAQRPAGKIAAGKWEFPGGKIERGESAEAALRRELHEELGISVITARPLIRVAHDYSDRRVLLDTWLVSAWTGEIHGREQQAFDWVQPEHLGGHDLLAADGPIVNALVLPTQYVFTPADAEASVIRNGLDRLPRSSLLRLRLPHLGEPDYEALAKALLPEVRSCGLRLILDRDPAMVVRVGADGWHVRASVLHQYRQRPVGIGLVLGSCHDQRELALAAGLPVDAVVIGPVQATASHPGSAGLGWDGFSALSAQVSLPAYAIGGLAPEHASNAHQYYGQGVAGISAYWSR